VQHFDIFITPRAWDELKHLPGNMRQRIRQRIKQLAEDPYAHDCKPLSLSQLEQRAYRVRIDRWRIIYTVSEADQVIDILAIRKRPPYDYGDLSTLIPS
jgi:mRNA interferase RelE/StbE